MDFGKQYRPRSDDTEWGNWSESAIKEKHSILNHSFK